MRGSPGALVPSRFTGTVAGVHAGVLNIDAGGYFVSLLKDPRDRTALSVLVHREGSEPLWAPGPDRSGPVQPGASVEGSPTHLDVTGAGRIHYDPRVPRFSGFLANARGIAASHPARLTERCRDVLEQLESCPDDHRGFVPLILSRPAGTDPFVERARRILTEAVREGRPRLDLSRLVGLGPGFTPAGDDFLAGVMLAEKFLGDYHCPVRLDREAVRAALARTTTGGATLLRLALAGRPPLVAHRIYAIMDRSDATAGAIRAARRYGHSSGLDLLAGFLWLGTLDR